MGVEDVPEALREMFARGRSAEALVGLSEQAAMERARVEDAERVRVFRVGTHVAWHADHRPDRLNLVIQDGAVILASYF